MVEPTKGIALGPAVDIQSFYLIRLIGRGGYGKVLLVKKKDTGVLYALKVLKKKLLEKEDQYERIVAERGVLATARHPFIIKMSHAFQNDRKLYFTLDYCPGGELRYLLARMKVFNEDMYYFYFTRISSSGLGRDFMLRR